jgi:hypothetical protein
MMTTEHECRETPVTNALVGASVWEKALYDHLTSHIEKERDLLVSYQAAAAYSQSPAFRYLASLVIEDELRHHRHFEDLAASVRADAECQPQISPIPHLDLPDGDAERVIGLAADLIAEEERDAVELRHLARELRDVKDTTLWQLLVRLMELDTAKHLEILRFVRRHAKMPL